VSIAGPIFILLALALVALAGRRALPLLLFSLSPESLRVWFDDTPQSATTTSRSPALRDLVGQMKSLGFLSLGLKVEKLPLGGPAYREVALASAERSAFASIVLSPGGEPASFYFYTPFEAGGMVFTRNFAFGREAEAPPVSVRNVPGRAPEDVLAAHNERVRDFHALGLRPIGSYTQKGRIEATRAFYASAYARRGIAYLRSPDVLAFFFMLAVLALAVVATVL
jgi:hypothetical protein